MRRPSSQHLIEDGGERIDIRARIDLLSIELFRRHVERRANQKPRFGWSVSGRAILILLMPRDAEIRQRRPAIVIDEDIARLDIPVSDPMGMR
jgi:hypothetical protein